jgi:hypothetical protein
MHENFDCHDAHLESRNLIKDFTSLVGSILTPSGPSTSESIATLNDLDEETKIAWEVPKAQFILNKKTWVPHHMLFLPWHFFVVNDGSKLNDLPFYLPKLQCW